MFVSTRFSRLPIAAALLAGLLQAGCESNKTVDVAAANPPPSAAAPASAPAPASAAAPTQLPTSGTAKVVQAAAPVVRVADTRPVSAPLRAADVPVAKPAAPSQPAAVTAPVVAVAPPPSPPAAAEVAPAAPIETAAVRPKPPVRGAERHVLSFYQSSIKVYDAPYGRVLHSVAETQFPRVRIKGDQTGVPVYAQRQSFVQVPLPQGGEGWVPLELVKLTAVPCAIEQRGTQRPAGPIGAGSSSVECAKN